MGELGETDWRTKVCEEARNACATEGAPRVQVARRGQGFPLWAADGSEKIASAERQALEGLTPEGPRPQRRWPRRPPDFQCQIKPHENLRPAAASRNGGPPPSLRGRCRPRRAQRLYTDSSLGQCEPPIFLKSAFPPNLRLRSSIYQAFPWKTIPRSLPDHDHRVTRGFCPASPPV